MQFKDRAGLGHEVFLVDLEMLEPLWPPSYNLRKLRVLRRLRQLLNYAISGGCA